MGRTITIVFISIIVIGYFFIRNKVTGVYTSNVNKNSVNTLEILSNNTYKRVFYPDKHNPNLQYSNTGVWEKSDHTIYFQGWCSLDNLDTVSADKYIFGTEIHHEFFFGKVRLLIDDDLDYYYIKL